MSLEHIASVLGSIVLIIVGLCVLVSTVRHDWTLIRAALLKEHPRRISGARTAAGNASTYASSATTGVSHASTAANA